MSNTFSAIKKVVVRHKLNTAGFGRRQVASLYTGAIPKRTIETFIGKHAIGGGNTPTLYFTKISYAKYKINDQYLP